MGSSLARAARKSSRHHGCTSAVSATAHFKISTISASWQFNKHRCLVNASPTKKDWPHQYERARLDCVVWIECNRTHSNGGIGRELESFYGKGALAGLQDGVVNEIVQQIMT